MLEQAKQLDHSQRVHVEMERRADGPRVKIRLESYDEVLGWYSAGSLTVPLHQLPLIEQGLTEMRRADRSEEYGKIIPFPGLTAAVNT